MAVNGGHVGTKKGPNWGHIMVFSRDSVRSAPKSAASKVPGKTVFSGAEGTESLEKNCIFGCRANKILGEGLDWYVGVRYTIQVKFRRESFSYAVTVGKFSGINFVNSYSFRTFKN